MLVSNAMQTDLFTCDVHPIDLPDAGLRYCESFLSDSQALYSQLLEEIDWRQDTITLYGRPVLIPRLNAWYGEPGADYSYSGLALQPLPWTPALLDIKERVEAFVGESFNSALANLYRDGRDSVSWHSDDEYELGEAPLIASVSLGATRRFSLRHRRDKSLDTVHLDLQDGSLLVMSGATQRHWAHQVPKTRSAVGGRINLTFRRILRTRS